MTESPVVGLYEICARTGLEATDLQRWYEQGSFPKPNHYPNDLPAWDWPVVADWVARHCLHVGKDFEEQFRPLNLQAVAARIGVKYHTLATWKHRGRLPKPDWRLSDVDLWKAATIDKWNRERTTASQ